MVFSAFFPFTLLVACQFLGEYLSRVLHLPLPGALTGAVLLFGLLIAFPKLHAKIAGFCHTLVRNLLLFYVPASVGIMKIFGDVAKQGLLLVAVIVVTTWATALVAAIAFDACRKKAA